MTLPEEAVNELTPEMIEQIENTSLEDLLEDLTGLETIADKVELGELPEDELTPAMESLRGMIEDLRHSGSICRTDAHAIQSMTASMEGFEDTFATMPLASFTQMPSKVNYTASMENLLSAVARKIIEAIKKVIRFLREKGRALLSALRGGAKTTAQVKAACDQVVKKHTPVTEPEIVKEVRKEMAKPSEKPSPIVKKVLVEVKKAPETTVTEVEATARVVEVVRDELKAAIPDMYIEFYENDLFGKWRLALHNLIMSANKVLKDHDTVSFLGNVSEILEDLTGLDGKGSLDISRLGEAGGAERMHKNTAVITRHMGMAQVQLSRKARSYEMIKTRDELSCINGMASGLAKYKAAVADVGKDITLGMRYIDDQLRKFDQLVDSNPEQDVLQQAQESAALLQLVSATLNFTHRRQEDINLYIGNIAKMVHNYRV